MAARSVAGVAALVGLGLAGALPSAEGPSVPRAEAAAQGAARAPVRGGESVDPRAGEATAVARDLGGLPARLAALMVASEPGGSLAPRLLAFPVPGTEDGRAGGRVPVAVLVELSAADVPAAGADRAPEDRGLDLHVYAVEPGGTVAGFLAQRVPLPSEARGPSAGRGAAAPAVRFLGRLELAPGEHLLRLLVHHGGSGRFGRGQLRLTVPEAGAAAWPQLTEAPRDGEEEDASGSSIFLVHQGDDEARRVEEVEALARRLADAGLSLGRVDFPGGSRAGPGAGGAGALVPEAPPRRGVAGSEVSGPGGELAAAYARAIALLPVGWSAAADALAAAEERVLAAEPIAGAQILDRVERAEAARLAAGRPEVLLPLALLHRDLFHRHARAGRHVASVVARGLAVDLAEAHVLGVSGPGSGHRDAGAVRRSRRLLVDLVAELFFRGALSTGEKILARADGLDPDRPDALTFLLAAVAAERRGDHAGALERLRRIDPGRHVGRRELADPVTAEPTLRLAVNLARAGEVAEAASRLDRILAAASPGWILAVAYAERARLLREEGRLDAAAALLGRGLERLPDDASLRIALAHLEERRGEPAAAREALAGISPAPADRPSPRRRYNSWPRPLLEASRRALEAAAEARMEPLVEAASDTGAVEAAPLSETGAGAGG